MDTDKNKKYLFENYTYEIIGCCLEVHKELGCGFHEQVYQEALVVEMSRKNIPFEKEKQLIVNYKDTVLNRRYIADFICYDKIILEIKAVEQLANQHIAQVLNYLKATDMKLGLLVNFGTTSLQHKRLVI
ncbi:MAG: GxxExxY protein [Candidatus Cloacimonetes bacterium]|nr:GxxExxY protein [Candidatus Cloacimonadota bacterium]